VKLLETHDVKRIHSLYYAKNIYTYRRSFT
jgi:hypothetical protein